MFYKKYGFNKLTHLLSPVVLKTSSIIYPFQSELHKFTLTDTPQGLTKDDLYIQSHPLVFCHNVVGYSGDAEGKFIRKAIQIIKFYKTLCIDPDIKYIRPNQGIITIPNRALVVHNYSPIEFGYEYKKSAWKLFWRYNNSVNTLIMKTKTNLDKKNIFITIDLPDVIPTRETLNRFIKQLTLNRLRSIRDYRYFNLLALWTYLTPEFKDKSWLSKYEPNERIRINLILQTNNKAVIINLGLLDSVITEYKDEASIPTAQIEDYYSYLSNPLNNDLLGQIAFEDATMLTKGSYKAEVARKLFLFSLIKLVKLQTESVDISFGLTNKAVDIKNKNIEKKTDESAFSILKDAKDLDKEVERLIQEESNVGNRKDYDPDSITGIKIEEPKDEMEIEDQDLANYLKEFESEDEEDELNVKEQDLNLTNLSVNGVYTQKPEDKKDSLRKVVSNLKEDGQINKARENTLNKIISNQDEVKYKINGEEIELSKILDNNQDLEKDKLKDQSVNEVPTVFDKSFNKNNVKNIDKQYLDNNMQIDSIRVAYSLQNNKNLLVESYDVQENSSILDTTEYHTIKLKHLDGKSTTIKYLIPKIDEDGTFKMSGNRYRLRKQRLETPIRKISPTRVVLSSYYGKLFIDKAYKKAYSYGSWYLRQLYRNPDVTNIVEDGMIYPDSEINSLYGCLAYSIKSFQYKDFLFSLDYERRNFNTLTNEDLKKLETDGVVVGKNKDTYIVMSNTDYRLSKVNLKTLVKEDFGTMLDILGEGQDQYDGPIEFAGIRICGSHVPIVIPLSYYFGLENLLNILKVKYLVYDGSEEAKEKRKLIPQDELRKMVKINFFDKSLYFSRDFGLGDMILGGLQYIKETTETMFGSWNKRNSFTGVFLNTNLSPNVQSEIKVIENMFIDPMTLSLLKELKEPETFTGLLFKACELLLEYKYRHPNEITGQIFKGYERINGMLYKSLAKAVSKYEFESIYSNAKLTLDPYEILKKIKDDSTTVNVDDLNPLVEIKQSDDVSYLGEGGRDVITMTKATRSIHPTEIGIISEATKDNGQVGVTAYLSADPNVKSVRGLVEPIDVEKEGWGKVLSTASLLYPFSDRDTARRTNFASIQGAHVIPINEMRAPAVRTGYDSIIALRVSDKFAVSAEDDGRVIDVTNKYIEVEYQSKNKKKYIMKKWTTKEEGGACYSHELIPNFEKGDSFRKDDTLLYDSLFFEPDIFYPGRVIYKEGTLINVAITDDPETYEDSGAVSHKLKDRLGVKTTKVISIVVSQDDELLNIRKIGDIVEPTDILFTFINKDAMNFSSDEMKLDPESLQLLKDMRSSSPKAKVRGKIKNVKIFYNGELDNMTPSLREAVNESDKRLRVNDGYPGKVNSSYSINGNPLSEGSIEIKYYIEVSEQLSLGDKAIFGNQLKFTIGDVYDNSVVGEKTGEEVEAFFGYTAIQARIVNSPLFIGTTSSLVEAIEKKAIEIYFGETK